MRVASIDVGTNTFRLFVADSEGGGRLRAICVDRAVTRLGGGFKDGLISTEASQRGIQTLRRFSQILSRYGVEAVRAVATSVVRESRNGAEFIESVLRETGIRLEVISGEQEARLTVRGVLESVSPASARSLIFDVGGGSTEYIHVGGGKILGLVSAKMGVVNLQERFIASDVPTADEIRAVLGEIEGVLARELSWMDGSPQDLTLIATAGTPTTLAAIDLELESYDAEAVNGYRLKRAKVDAMFTRLAAMRASERLCVRGLERGREDVIIPGTLVLLRTMDYFGADEILVSDGGLLEGVAYEMI
ncbi:MAG: Ppx/GppA phosphatase family protein [Deltaproteobacteria bacterium]